MVLKKVDFNGNKSYELTFMNDNDDSTTEEEEEFFKLMKDITSKLSRKNKEIHPFINKHKEQNTEYLKTKLYFAGNKITTIFRTQKGKNKLDITPKEGQKLEGYFSLNMDSIFEFTRKHTDGTMTTTYHCTPKVNDCIYKLSSYVAPKRVANSKNDEKKFEKLFSNNEEEDEEEDVQEKVTKPKKESLLEDDDSDVEIKPKQEANMAELEEEE